MNDTITVFGTIIDGRTERPKNRIDASKIIDRLYLGSYEKAALMKEGLDAYGITHVLTVGFMMPIEYPKDFVYHVVTLEDSPDSDISKYFDECFEFIDNALQSNETNKVLIHCWAGISRSATITIGYLIHSYQFSYVESCEHVRKARHWISPNSGFRQQLKDYSISNGKKVSNAEKYELCAKILKRMHKKRTISMENYEKVVNDFKNIFGSFHQHTNDVKLEMNCFLKD